MDDIGGYCNETEKEKTKTKTGDDGIIDDMAMRINVTNRRVNSSGRILDNSSRSSTKLRGRRFFFVSLGLET